MGVTRELAERCAAFRFAGLPAAVVERAKLILLDTLGAMLAASPPRYSASRILLESVRQWGGTPECTLVGRAWKTSCIHAALANGTLGYYCDIEPHHPAAILHGPAAMVPTALAFAERGRRSGADFLAAQVLGNEVAVRVSLALDPRALYARGFHPSAVCGAFGAAAAAGHLLGLDAGRLCSAFGLAGTQAAGLLAWASDHTEHSRPFNPGIAARNGATATFLAHGGFGGPPAIFEGKYDAGTAFGGKLDAGRLAAGWGQHYHLPEFAFKRYASCGFTHPGLDALLGIMRDEGLTHERIASLTMRFPTSGANIIDNNPLKSHCAQYVLPVGAVRGEVLIDDILQDRLEDPAIRRLTAAMRFERDAELERVYPERYATIVEVQTTDGRALTRRVDWAKGTPENPLTDAEVEAKFRRLVSAVLPAGQADKLLACVRGIERAPDLTELSALLQVDQE
jgi:2-methylcitrate dehydratase PrpD